MTPPATTLPAAITTLTSRMVEGWTHHITGPRTGTIEVSYYGDPRSDGTRPILQREVSVMSFMLSGCHPATRRAFRALWMRRLDKAKASWSMDVAVRGRHDGEHAPRHLDFGQLEVYAGSASVLDYEAQLELLAAKRAETKRKGAATRAARRAGSTELSDYGSTDIKGEAA
jgi:hypothetical protein